MASWGSCWKMWLHREKYFHWNTQRALLDVLSRSSEMEKKAKVLGGALQSHTSTTIFLWISRPPTTWENKCSQRDENQKLARYKEHTLFRRCIQVNHNYSTSLASKLIYISQVLWNIWMNYVFSAVITTIYTLKGLNKIM